MFGGEVKREVSTQATLNVGPSPEDEFADQPLSKNAQKTTCMNDLPSSVLRLSRPPTSVKTSRPCKNNARFEARTPKTSICLGRRGARCRSLWRSAKENQDWVGRCARGLVTFGQAPHSSPPLLPGAAMLRGPHKHCTIDDGMCLSDTTDMGGSHVPTHFRPPPGRVVGN